MSDSAQNDPSPVRLIDLVKTEESRIYGTIVFVDITNSTDLKQKGVAEIGWVTSIAMVYDSIGEQILKEEWASLVKYLGDGAMVFFTGGHETEAINSAIRIQESISRRTQEDNTEVFVSIGVATGEMYRIETPKKAVDYLGLVVDRAARLCSVANSRAIFVDDETINGVLLRNIASEQGKVSKRKPGEYRGDEEKIKLKGFRLPVKYYEILWERARFGLKSQVGTESSMEDSTLPPPPPPDTPAPTQSKSPPLGKYVKGLR